uniref:Branchpoint-bridging protein n=1 Tax=Panagrolaimus superbus TaxID=310955 RepID=A0A914Z408_9BILA
MSKSKRSRWSDQKVFVPGMPTILPQEINEEQTKIYLLQIEIEELTRRLRTNQYSNQDDRRSPSPEPTYDMNGKRTNTREVRKKHELEQRRHEKVQALIKLKPDYNPPADYRPPNIRLHEKIWIPQDERREINFVGLLIGPRGNTLKALETETGARIIIRGKGSVKEGKAIRRDGPMPGESEPLHAYVTGTDPAVIKVACDKIKSILDDALNRPEANNSLRQNQLRELALLNGTLRTEDAFGGSRCSNCGSDQHKTYECPETPNITANIICSSCGGAGHIAKDCVTPRTGYKADNNKELDDEYAALLAEIYGCPSKSRNSSTSTNTATSTNTLIPFRLPLQQGHPLQPQPSMQFQQNQQQQFSGNYVSPPQFPSFLAPPPPPPPVASPWMMMPPQAPFQMIWPSHLPPPPPPPE